MKIIFNQCNKRKLLLSLLVAVIFWSMAYIVSKGGVRSLVTPMTKEQAFTDESKMTALDVYYPVAVNKVDELNYKESIYAALSRLGINNAQALKISQSLNKLPEAKKVRAKDKIVILGKSSETQLLKSSLIQAQKVEIFIKDDQGVAYSLYALANADEPDVIDCGVNRPKITKRNTMISGKVNSSLYSSMLNSGAEPNLINNFSDIFSWQIDFYRETRSGDDFKLVVDKKYVEGRFVGYGPVVAAEYISGRKKLRAFSFMSNDGKVLGFFDEAGQSLKNAFLKSPIKLANIGSKFGMRFHPILKRHKPHNGVDYGARRGTPIMAVASGVVIDAGYSRFNGNWVRIRHHNGYDTEYLHAHTLAKGMRVGAKVNQSQIIAYVGSTGLATGDHLHFGMRKNGKYVDPTKQSFARGFGIPKNYMKEFLSQIEPLVIAFNQHKVDSSVIAYKEKSPNDA
jgi:murein DD-endopeptidase MepM/ murein hydrolase activator NlpD